MKLWQMWLIIFYVSVAPILSVSAAVGIALVSFLSFLIFGALKK